MANSKLKLNYDSRGGVIVQSRAMLDSPEYEALSPQAKVLMTLLQRHWRNDQPIDYGIREAKKKIPCAKSTAINAFKMLESAGFIVKIGESLFNSRTMSKSRTWRLTWMPYKNKDPTHEWQKLKPPVQI